MPMVQDNRESKGANGEPKFEIDPLRLLGFLPGANKTVNLQKKKFFELLVKKGLVYMYDHHYDLDPDSPILRTDEEETAPRKDVKINPADVLACSPLEGVGIQGGALQAGSMAKKPQILQSQQTKRTESLSHKKTHNPKTVVIVGAGISGLGAAYELKRAGHKVIILERQQRVGGRIKTLHFQFDPSGLRGEAGAMRIPLENRHYLTDAYIEKFDLKTKPFYNVDPEHNCFVSVHGITVRVSDFQSERKEEWSRAKEMCDKLWPGWDARIKCLKEKYRIHHIMDYYKLTIKEVSESAPKLCNDEEGDPADGEAKVESTEGISPEKYARKWRKWMERWSKMSFYEFLASDVPCYSWQCKPKFRPWPKVAIDCIINIHYLANTEVSVATMLAEEIGQWWTPEMKTLKNGMEELPEAFIKDSADPYCLENDVHYGITVHEVEWRKPESGDGGHCSYSVKVCGRQTQTGNEIHFQADAVILTVPLNIMRQVKFSPLLPEHISDAISGIRYEPSTKIFLGFREKFWEKSPRYPIENGGISRTNLPIGQIVYPGKQRGCEKTTRGVLLLYTWNKEALLFGSQPEDEAITEALREVQEVYRGLLDDDRNASQVIDSFEAGAIQAWYSDPSAQGAYVHLLPYSYMNHIRTLLEPKEIYPIFFGGEAISFANGWIQGALESGLRAAWQFFKFNEKLYSNEKMPEPGPGPLPNPFSQPDFNMNERINLPFLGLSKYPFPI